jgi:hypothetical protein
MNRSTPALLGTTLFAALGLVGHQASANGVPGTAFVVQQGSNASCLAILPGSVFVAGRGEDRDGFVQTLMAIRENVPSPFAEL